MQTDELKRMNILLSVRVAKQGKLALIIDDLKQLEGVFAVTCE